MQIYSVENYTSLDIITHKASWQKKVVGSSNRVVKNRRLPLNECQGIAPRGFLGVGSRETLPGVGSNPTDANLPLGKCFAPLGQGRTLVMTVTSSLGRAGVLSLVYYIPRKLTREE